MKTFGIFSLILTLLVGLSLPARANSPAEVATGFPPYHAYNSNGRVAAVRSVQLALERRGYYVGDNHGNLCYETRRAIKRYRATHGGLGTSGKVDAQLLSALALW